MKTLSKLFFGILVLVSCWKQTYCQSTTFGLGGLGHTGGPAANYLGWQTNNPLHFRTNDLTNARNRMIIAGGAFGANGGQIAMGNNLPNTFNPTARLHLHQNVISNNFLRFSHAGTNSTATDGLQIGIDNAGNAQFIQNESHLPFQFWINSTPFGGTPRTWERMTITANNFQVNQWNTGSRSISTDTNYFIG